MGGLRGSIYLHSKYEIVQGYTVPVARNDPWLNQIIHHACLFVGGLNSEFFLLPDKLVYQQGERA